MCHAQADGREDWGSLDPSLRPVRWPVFRTATPCKSLKQRHEICVENSRSTLRQQLGHSSKC